MKTANVRQIQHHFRDVLAWVQEGEEVEITSNRKTVARLVPARPAKKRKFKLPDFEARLKRIYGKKIVSSRAVAAVLAGNKGNY